MQIILTQMEIEQAITEYVHSQINIKDNMQIDIKLAATRGDGGFTANINIVPMENKEVVNTPKVPTKEPVEKTGLVGRPKATIIDDVTTPDVEPVYTTGLASGEVSAELAAGNTEEVTGEVTAPKKTSLFANLNKPVNS